MTTTAIDARPIFGVAEVRRVHVALGLARGTGPAREHGLEELRASGNVLIRRLIKGWGDGDIDELIAWLIERNGSLTIRASQSVEEALLAEIFDALAVARGSPIRCIRE